MIFHFVGSKVSLEGVMCNPPPPIAKLHQEIKEKLTLELSTQNQKLKEENSIPAIVTVVNSSRVKSDIRRDLKRVSGKRIEGFIILWINRIS